MLQYRYIFVGKLPPAKKKASPKLHKSSLALKSGSFLHFVPVENKETCNKRHRYCKYGYEGRSPCDDVFSVFWFIVFRAHSQVSFSFKFILWSSCGSVSYCFGTKLPPQWRQTYPIFPLSRILAISSLHCLQIIGDPPCMISYAQKIVRPTKAAAELIIAVVDRIFPTTDIR